MNDDTAGPGTLSLSPSATWPEQLHTGAGRSSSVLGSFARHARTADQPTSRVSMQMLTDACEDETLETTFLPARLATLHEKSAYATWLNSSHLAYARHAVRIPYRHRMAIIPLGDADQPLIDQAVLVRGRDLSAQGISIVHREPLFHRSFWIAFVEEHAAQPVWRAELKWCRFTRQGHYISGGKLIDRVEIDHDLLTDLQSFPAG